MSSSGGELEALFRLFATHPGHGVVATKDNATNGKLASSVALCAALLAKDFVVLPLRNDAQLCASYPPDLLLVLRARNSHINVINGNNNGGNKPSTTTTTTGSKSSSVKTSHVGDDDDDEDSVQLEAVDDYDENDDSGAMFGLELDDGSTSERDRRIPAPAAVDHALGDDAVDPRLIHDWTRLASAARLARVRTRFPVPVLAYRDHVLCRSSTLAHKLELMLNRSSSDSVTASGDGGGGADDESDSGVDRARRKDIELLKMLGVTFICDLMVEDRKQVYGVNVCSSEKVDQRDRYASFALASMPYPGCEFFREVVLAGGEARGLMPPSPDVDPSGCNARFRELAPCQLPTAAEYRTLDLVALTQRYLKMLLHLLTVGGVSCHCISGWDRTPLFVSLMRISLWADGAAHQSLSVDEILYLTVAYDWMLFGHQLRDRATRQEMVFTFCFDFLMHIEDAQFSIDALSARRSASDVRVATRGSPAATVSANGGSAPKNTTPIAIARVASNNSLPAGGSLGAASSWQLVEQEEQVLSVSSFDDNISGNEQPISASRASRRAQRLSELRLRFRQIFDTTMKPLLSDVMATGQSDLVGLSKQLWRLVAENR